MTIRKKVGIKGWGPGHKKHKQTITAVDEIDALLNDAITEGRMECIRISSCVCASSCKYCTHLHYLLPNLDISMAHGLDRTAFYY